MSRQSPAPAFALSLVLHALAFALVVTGILSPEPSRQAAATLLRRPETVNFRFVEVPETAPRDPTAKSELVSERGTRAADHAPRDLPEGAPFSRGRSSAGEPLPGEGGRAETRGAAERAAPAPEAGPAARADQPSASLTPDAARALTPTGELAAEVRRAGGLGDRRLELPRRDLRAPPRPLNAGGRARGLPQVDNRLTRASYDGEFSLSTYEWDYAPYMRRLKRQIEEYTWTILPSAFWYGIAAWATQVRFTILPDGRLESIGITGHEGVLDLRHVAPDAVTGAAEFEPLPPGFPEPKLTVTGNFYFNVFPPGGESEETQEAP